MTRHTRPAAALAVAGALLLAGCGTAAADPSEIPVVTDPVAGEVAEGILDGYSMTFAGDGGTTQDAQLEAFFTPFAEQSGVAFTQDSPQTNAKIEAQIDSGNYQWDLVSTYGDIVARDCGVLFEELDFSKLDTSHVPESLLGDTTCGIPSIAYALVMVSNDDAFGADGPKNWADFFDTTAFPGTRAIYSGDGVIDGPTVQAASIAAGWDPSTPYTLEWAEKGLDKLDSIADSVVFYSTGAQAQQMLEVGEAKMGAVWNGRALAAESNGASLTPSWDDWISITDFFAIVKGAPKAELAYHALNYALGAEQQAKWSELSGYSPLNTESAPQVDELQEKYLTTTEERQATGVPVMLDFWKDPEAVSQLQDRWSTIVAGG